jgi:nucleoside-diphosphate-sugar epimerase
MWLITGSSGLIGSNLCAELERDGIRHIRTSRRAMPQTSFSVDFPADLSIPNIDWGLISNRVTGIVHLASAVPHSPEYPDNSTSADKTEAMDANLVNLQEVTNAPLVYMSTCGLYSKLVDAVHMEEEVGALFPRSPYFLAKLNGERRVNQITNSTILRLSSPVSANPKSNLVLGKMISDARTKGVISVYGNGTREQDFIGVHDTTLAIIKVMDSNSFGTFNLCSSVATDMLTLARVINKYIPSSQIKVAEKLDENEGHRARYANSKLKETIDWNPVTDIETLIETLEV